MLNVALIFSKFGKILTSLLSSCSPPAYPARPRAGGHARSSSLDLTRNMINFNSASKFPALFLFWQSFGRCDGIAEGSKRQILRLTHSNSIFFQTSLNRAPLRHRHRPAPRRIRELPQASPAAAVRSASATIRHRQTDRPPADRRGQAVLPAGSAHQVRTTQADCELDRTGQLAKGAQLSGGVCL